MADRPKEELWDIVDGFKINWMNIRDADTGVIQWEKEGGWEDVHDDEIAIDIPASILKCGSVSREMNFTSKEMIRNFRLVQQVLLHGKPIEEWQFEFGFVIPGSTNSWQCVIDSAGEGNMIPASVLDGNIVIETTFYDGDDKVSTSKIRVYYDDEK